MKTILRSRKLWLLLVLVALGVGWRVRAERDVDRLWRDDPAVVVPYADAVAHDLRDGVPASWFTTGSARFDGEWALGTCQMAALGLARVVRRRPELRSRYASSAAECGRWLLDEQSRSFGTVAWREDGLDALHTDRAHAYLGWLAVGLGAAREVSGDPALAAPHDELVASLARRLDTLEVHALETYPGEVYPPDIAMVAAAVAAHGEHDEVLARFWPRFEAAAVDPDTGLLFQALHPRTGAPLDAPRGSGSALVASLLAEANPDLSRRLAVAVRASLHRQVLGHGGVREVPAGWPGRADIDSGPVLLGVSVSATGFALGAARRLDDRGWHASLGRTADLFGVPWTWQGRRRYLTGGALGNAILLAMETTPRPASSGQRVGTR